MNKWLTVCRMNSVIEIDLLNRTIYVPFELEKEIMAHIASQKWEENVLSIVKTIADQTKLIKVVFDEQYGLVPDFRL